MAGGVREWADIDQAWLQDYLRENRLAGGFDLDDDLLGSQVSWILSDQEWDRLRLAWDESSPTAQGGDTPDATQAAPPPGSVPPDAVEQAAPTEPQPIDPPQGEAASTSEAPAPPDFAVAGHGLENQGRLSQLVETALSDWAAFKELFGDSPHSELLESCEHLADSPGAMLEEAARLIPLERQKAEAQGKKDERDFEQRVNRAQNIIAGYLLYCRKAGLTPTLEHMLVHIPLMRSGYSTEITREAWRRQGERSS